MLYWAGTAVITLGRHFSPRTPDSRPPGSWLGLGRTRAGGGAGLRPVPPLPSPLRSGGASRLSSRQPSSARPPDTPGRGGRHIGAQDTEPQLESLTGSRKGSGEEGGLSQGPLCCPQVVQTHCS